MFFVGTQFIYFMIQLLGFYSLDTLLLPSVFSTWKFSAFPYSHPKSVDFWYTVFENPQGLLFLFFGRVNFKNFIKFPVEDSNDFITMSILIS